MCSQVLTSGATSCGTASHANKATTGLTSLSFLAMKGNAKTAFCKPCLAMDDLDPALIESLLGRADVDWPVKFNLIRCEEVTDLQKKESDMSDRALTVKKVKNGYMTPLERVKLGSMLKDTEDAWGASYKELNNLEDVSIALQNVGEETDETKRTSLFNDFQTAVASKLDLHVFHTLTSHELMDKWNHNSTNASFASLEETVAGLRAMLDGQIGI